MPSGSYREKMRTKGKRKDGKEFPALLSPPAALRLCYVCVPSFLPFPVFSRYADDSFSREKLLLSGGGRVSVVVDVDGEREGSETAREC